MGVMDTLTRSTADTVAKTDAKKWAMDRSEALRVVFHALDGDDSGSIEIFAVPHTRTAARERVAYLPERLPATWHWRRIMAFARHRRALILRALLRSRS